jgi:hypothetical protein
VSVRERAENAWRAAIIEFVAGEVLIEFVATGQNHDRHRFWWSSPSSSWGADVSKDPIGAGPVW